MGRAAGSAGLRGGFFPAAGRRVRRYHPRLNLPERVTGLAATRAGDQVSLTLDHAQEEHR